jgi:hypothetical protein
MEVMLGDFGAKASKALKLPFLPLRMKALWEEAQSGHRETI